MKLSDYLKKSGLSLGQFAEKAGVHRSAIYRYLNRETRPGAKAMLKIVDATDGDVTLEELAEETLEQEPELKAS